MIYRHLLVELMRCMLHHFNNTHCSIYCSVSTHIEQRDLQTNGILLSWSGRPEESLPVSQAAARLVELLFPPRAKMTLWIQ